MEGKKIEGFVELRFHDTVDVRWAVGAVGCLWEAEVDAAQVQVLMSERERKQCDLSWLLRACANAKKMRRDQMRQTHTSSPGE